MTGNTNYNLFPEDEDEVKYKLLRNFLGPPRRRRAFRSGLTLKEARAHMEKPYSSSATDESDFSKRLVAKSGHYYDTFEPQTPKSVIRRLWAERFEVAPDTERRSNFDNI